MFKTLIEVALPIEAINDSCKQVPSRPGHPATLHKWWGRRPMSATRAVLFSSLVADPDDPEAPTDFIRACEDLPYEGSTARQKLFLFIEELLTWESNTDEELLEQALHLINLSTGGNPPPVLDPFAGGGTIPLEALRLGLSANASDLNPVPVMINKAMIEVPSIVAGMHPANPESRNNEYDGLDGIIDDIKYYGDWMRDRAFERIGHLYPTYCNETVLVYLWANSVRCPNPMCGAVIPLLVSFSVVPNKVYIQPKIEDKVSFTMQHGDGEVPQSPKMGRGAKFRCLICNEIAPDQHIKDEGMAGRMKEQLIGIVTTGENGKAYYAPTPEQEAPAMQAQPEWIPKGKVQGRVWGQCYGKSDIADYFTSRQLTALTTFSDLVGEARTQIYQDALHTGMSRDNTPLRDGGTGAKAYAEAVSLYLSLAVDKCMYYWSKNTIWSCHRSGVAGTFNRPSIQMMWNFAEVNPFSHREGGWSNMSIKWIIKVLKQLPLTRESVSVTQCDVTKVDAETAYLISTDPPYYDNVRYADLSDFFYVWLRNSLKDVYPDIFSTMLVPKNQELVPVPERFNGNRLAARLHFEDGMRQAFCSMRKITSPDFPLTVWYAFKQQDKLKEGTSNTGWETILIGLIDAGFQIIRTWPIRSEMKQRINAQQVNALSSTILLVCRHRLPNAPITTRRDFLKELRITLSADIDDILSGEIAPVDLAQACIGPGISVFSKYAKVLDPDGTKMDIRTALQLINSELDTQFSNVEGEMDSESRFALSWFEQYGFREGDFGQADVLARAKNASLDSLIKAGVLVSGSGQVRLISWEQLQPPETPVQTVWEATHHLIKCLQHHGELATKEFLTQLDARTATEAKSLSYRLYTICDLKSWFELAHHYNDLVIRWPSDSP